MQRGLTTTQTWLALLLLLALALLCQSGFAQDSEPTSVPDDPPATMFPHSQTARYWVSGQSNIIIQAHPSFDAKYSGPNSLSDRAEHAVSNVSTLYTGFSLTHSTEFFFDFESASGGGLTDALGLAGVTNVDVVRNPTLGATPYLARAMVRQIIPLSKEKVEGERGIFALATELPVRRLEFRAGKFGMADFFDQNDAGTDSHYQFMNWTAVNSGAYDYAADTRGYTVGAILEYDNRNWSLRFGEALMPRVANGIDLQWNLEKARAENIELELRPKLAFGATTLKLLSFINHANMGVYRQAVNDFLAGKTVRPDITAHTLQTTIKYGFEVNLLQEFAHHVRGFARWGWNEGQHESYAYTEVDEGIEAGADLAGYRWHRKLDRVGAVFISNGISADHQLYLKLGGRGFLLDDGTLTYGRENIFESYYNLHLWRGIFTGVDVQHINNPGYNRDRGPVLVAGARFHLEF